MIRGAQLACGVNMLNYGIQRIGPGIINVATTLEISVLRCDKNINKLFYNVTVTLFGNCLKYFSSATWKERF